MAGDPRRLIATYFGDYVAQLGGDASYFAVFRPCPPVALLAMSTGECVGKGLNIKSKSSVVGQLLGLVPFIQISDDADKADITFLPVGDPPVQIFFASRKNREVFIRELNEYTTLYTLDDDVVDRYGIAMPHSALRKIFIEMQELGGASLHGWETGRPSNPAFQDFSLSALHSLEEPLVVLVQADTDCVFNPHGLLMAHREGNMVYPVVSDMDLFTFGFKGALFQSLPRDQLDLAAWTLSRCEHAMINSSGSSWARDWLAAVHKEPPPQVKMPSFGFADPTSAEIIRGLIKATKYMGAVRHGPECFNFVFPQPIDEEFLVFSQEFARVPYKHMKKVELVRFLEDKANAGFTCPLHPIWPVRDPAFAAVYTVLAESRRLEPWFTPDMHEKISSLLQTQCGYLAGPKLPESHEFIRMLNDLPRELALMVKVEDLSEDVEGESCSVKVKGEGIEDVSLDFSIQRIVDKAVTPLTEQLSVITRKLSTLSIRETVKDEPSDSDDKMERVLNKLDIVLEEVQSLKGDHKVPGRAAGGRAAHSKLTKEQPFLNMEMNFKRGFLSLRGQWQISSDEVVTIQTSRDGEKCELDGKIIHFKFIEMLDAKEPTLRIRCEPTNGRMGDVQGTYVHRSKVVCWVNGDTWERIGEPPSLRKRSTRNTDSGDSSPAQPGRKQLRRPMTPMKKEHNTSASSPGCSNTGSPGARTPWR